jgi:hypothetical protein
MKRTEIKSMAWDKRKGRKLYAVTARTVHTSDGAEVFLVDITKRGEPIQRMAHDKENAEYATYLVGENKWSDRYLRRDYCDIQIGERRYSNRVIGEKAQVIGRASEIFKKAGWVAYVTNLQEDIKSIRDERRKSNRLKTLQDLEDETPEDAEGFKEWVKELNTKNFMYYKRQGRYAFLTCSKCGMREKYLTDIGDLTYEEQLQAIDIPRNLEESKCKFCGAKGIYRQEGRMQMTYQEEMPCLSVAKVGRKICITKSKVTKKWHLGEPEEWKITHEGRMWVEKGKAAKLGYFDSSGSITDQNNEIWANGGYYGHARCSWHGDYPIYGYEEAVKGSFLEHSGYELYGKDIVKYIKTYAKHPELEIIVKQGLRSIARDMIGGSTIFKKLDYTAKNAAGFLQISPYMWKMFKKGQGEHLDLYQMEKRLGWNLQPNIFRRILERYPAYELDHNLETILRFESAEKMLNYLGKERRRTMSTYADYLSMCADQGYDMTDTIVLFPKDLAAKHDRLVYEANKQKEKAREQEKNKQFPKIETSYEKLNRTMAWKKGTFLIRPAKNAGDIIHEGTTLHHCVGASDTYMSRHNEGKSYIFMLRKVEDPETPYATIEISKEKKILQWYQAYDKRPDENIIQPFLDSWLRKMRA